MNRPIITNGMQGDLPSLVFFRGTPLFHHVEQYGWEPWSFGQHGVDIHKVDPNHGGEKEYVRLTPMRQPHAENVSSIETLSALLRGIWAHLCSEAGIPQEAVPDVLAR